MPIYEVDPEEPDDWPYVSFDFSDEKGSNPESIILDWWLEDASHRAVRRFSLEELVDKQIDQRMDEQHFRQLYALRACLLRCAAKIEAALDADVREHVP